MQQAEGMAQFVGCYYKVNTNTAKDPRKATLFVPLSLSSPILTTVNDYEVNVLFAIKHLADFQNPNIPKIVTVWVSPIDAMHQRLTLCIRFNAEGLVSVTMRLHLLGIEGLNSTNRHFHRINHFLTKRAVIRQEVDHPHGARFAHVQRQPLARRARVIALPLLEID